MPGFKPREDTYDADVSAAYGECPKLKAVNLGVAILAAAGNTGYRQQGGEEQRHPDVAV